MNAPRTPHLAADPRDVAARVAATVRPEVRALTAYHVAKADGMIKLDANESPYPLPGEGFRRAAGMTAQRRWENIDAICEPT